MGSEWQKDLSRLCAWAKGEGFDAIDLNRATPEDLGTLKTAGLRVGTVDLPGGKALLTADAGARRDAVAKAADYIATSSAAGAKLFFTVVMPENPDQAVAEIHKLAVESFGELGKTAEAAGAKILFEGWPGPKNANLCCNPESCRAMFKDTGSSALGINYDPSHLIRMGIDHVRFAEEFASRIGHVHGKDTEILSEGAYEIGLFQNSILQKSHGFGGFAWRYTLPGQGIARWTRICQILKAAGFNGAISVELEDENFNGSEAGEKDGLIASLGYLRGV
jgi:sugar phosphate isomerase/epimerase